MDEFVPTFIIDKFSLSLFVCKVDIFSVMRTESKVDETQKSISCCDEENTIRGDYGSGVIASINKAREARTLLLPQ